MHKADNGMVRSLQVSGEYVVIGYRRRHRAVPRRRNRGGGVDARGGQRCGDVIAVSGEYVVIGYEDGTVRCLRRRNRGRRRGCTRRTTVR